MKNALLIVTLSALVTGCADISPRAESPGAAALPVAPAAAAPATTGTVSASEPATLTAAAPADVAPAEATQADAASAEPALPAVELTRELLFRLMTAEVAFQRGEWQAAYVTMYSAAQQTRDPRLARRATEIAITARRNDEAVAAIRLWRELAPQDEEATQYLLGFVVLGDEIETALPLLAERLENARPQTRGFLILQIQRMLSRARDKATAFRMLEKLVEPYSASATTRIALAQAAYNNGDAERAVSEARTALSMNPHSELAILTLAQVMPDKREATAALAAFLSTHPASREVRRAHARMQIEQQQFTKARAEFETLLAQQPDDTTALFALGILSSQAAEPERAEQYLRRYLELLEAQSDEAQDPTQALLLLAQIAEDRKDLPAALDWLSRIDSGPSYLAVQVRRAQLMAQQGHVDDALGLLHELKSDDQAEQVQILIASAQLLREAKRPAEAMQALQDGLKRFPNDPDLLYDTAMLAEKNAEHELMESMLRRLMVVAPENQHAYNALGYSLAERNTRLPEALTLIEKALSLAPNDPFILDSLGWVQYRLGQLNEAETSLRRAHSLRPDPEIAVHLGEVLWMKGLKDDAQKLWRDANAKDPHNGTLKDTLARLQVKL